MSYPGAVSSTPPHLGPVRESVHRASTPFAQQLLRLPPWAPLAAFFVLCLAAALITGPVGWTLFVLALALIGWMLYLSWPALGLNGRLMRIAVICFAVAVVVIQLVPR